MAASSSSAFLASVPPDRRSPIGMDEWEPGEGAVAARRQRDFERFLQLQAQLKGRCSALLHFSRHDFQALAESLPEAEKLCDGLKQLEPSKLTGSLAKFSMSLEALVQRISEREKLRIVFIGPVNAGKTTLINMLLTAALGDCETLLPTSPQAETNCIWRVTSCEGDQASVQVGEQTLRTWKSDNKDPKAMAGIRGEIADYLEEKLSRDAVFGAQHKEATVCLPLGMLNPFGCHYCLVDTPGYTESDEYEALVAKYLRDHSHIACMVCNLNQGKAVVQSTKNMMAKSYSRTFWVLTQYDDLMTKHGGRKSKNPRQIADKAVQSFRDEIREVDPEARVFTHAAQVLLPNEGGWQIVVPLPRQEAEGWLQAISLHVKGCFLQIQQQNHVLSSQSRHSLEAASDILNEYANLRDGSSGALAANEYYVRELQTSAEDVANDLERMIQREVEAVKTVELDKLCQQAGEALRSNGTWSFTRQQTYYRALSEELAPRIQRELQTRLDAAVNSAHARIVATAQRLLSQAGIDNTPVGARAQSAVAQPAADHLKARFPVESFMMWSAVAGVAGAGAITEAGGAILAGLGLRLGAASVAGLVGVAVVSFATLGYAAQKSAEVNPCWKYATVEADVVSRIRQGTQWGILSEASSSRARAQLLSGVAQFRYNFSVILLHRGTPRSVLETLFPDLPLFEEVHQSLERVASDVRAFTDSQDLATQAQAQLETCRHQVRIGAWAQVVEATSLYVEPNVRTDSIDGKALASLLHLRCFALVMADMFGEARHSSEVFQQTFPELLLPTLYHTAAHLRFEYLQGSLVLEETNKEIRSCLARLAEQHASREVPRELEIWFLAVVVSWADVYEARERLFNALRGLMAEQMKERPCLAKICDELAIDMRARLAAVGKELSQDVADCLRNLGKGPDLTAKLEVTTTDAAREAHDAAAEEYRRACDTYVNGVVNSVHLLLGVLPPSHIDMDAVGRPMVDQLLVEITRQLSKAIGGEKMEVDIRSALCPVDNGNVSSLWEEWIRIIGEALKGSSVQSIRREVEVVE